MSIRTSRSRQITLCLVLASSTIGSADAASWTKLSQARTGCGTLGALDYEIASDGRRLLYLETCSADETVDLYTVPIRGGSPVRINDPLPFGYGVRQASFTPDGSDVVFIAPQESLGVDELYVAPAAGGPWTKLHPDLAADRDVLWFQISADGDRVLYLSDQASPEVLELWSVSIHGGPVDRVSGVMAADGDVLYGIITPDGQRAVYVADQIADDRYELFSAPLVGSGVQQLNAPFFADEKLPLLVLPAISPDGSRVVYRTEGTINRDRLYVVPTTGGAARNLFPDAPAGIDFEDFAFSPDGSRIVFIAEAIEADRFGIYSVPTESGMPTLLAAPTVVGGDVTHFAISPDSSRVVFRADRNVDDRYELWSVPIDGGAVTRLNGSLIDDGDVFSDFRFSTDGQQVLFRADRDFDDLPSLWQIPLTGPTGSEVVIAGIVPSSTAWEIDPTRPRVVVNVVLFLVDTVSRLWEHSLVGSPDGLGYELLPDEVLAPDGDVVDFRIGPDGTVVYRADQGDDEVFELWALTSRFRDGFESGGTTAWSAARGR